MVGAAIIAPAGNTACMNLHLQGITASSTAAPVCVVGGWRVLEQPNNIVLLPGRSRRP
jgi:hypothetical protein